MIAKLKYILFSFWVIICLYILISQIFSYYFACDDSFISFRYARNLIEGNGLVFNIGERVEGYSNFLWVIISSIGLLLNISPDIWANSLSILATVLLLLAIFQIIKKNFNTNETLIIFGVALMYLAINRSFAVWASSGLETRLFTLLLFSAMVKSLIFDKNSSSLFFSSTLFGLAALTRMEAFLFFGEITLLELIILKKYKTWGKKQFVDWFMPFALLTGSYQIFRMLYFGYPLPNTFYAKVNEPYFSLGFDYLSAFFLEYQLWLLVPVIIIGVSGKSYFSKSLLKTLSLFVPFLFYLAYIGGDHFEYRMFDILLPFLALSLGIGFYRIVHLKINLFSRLAVSMMTIVVIVFAATIIPLIGEKAILPVYEVASAPKINFALYYKLRYLPGFKRYCDYYHKLYKNLTWHLCALRAEEHRLFARKVKTQTDILNSYISQGIIEPDAKLSLICMGYIPYYTRLEIVDYNGLTDSYVAHKGETAADKIGRRLLAHEKNAGMDYLKSRKVDYIYSVGFGFFTKKQPLPITLPGTYIVKLPEYYFSFRTTKSREEVLKSYGQFPVIYRTEDNRVISLN